MRIICACNKRITKVRTGFDHRCWLCAFFIHLQDYSYDASNKYGQSMLCISIDNTQQIKYISQQILYFHATIYDKNMHNPNSAQFESLFQSKKDKYRIQGLIFVAVKHSVLCVLH